MVTGTTYTVLTLSPCLTTPATLTTYTATVKYILHILTFYQLNYIKNSPSAQAVTTITCSSHGSGGIIETMTAVSIQFIANTLSGNLISSRI